MTASEASNKVGPSYTNIHEDILHPPKILCTYMAANSSKLFSLCNKRVFFSKDLPFLCLIGCAALITYPEVCCISDNDI